MMFSGMNTSMGEVEAPSRILSNARYRLHLEDDADAYF